MPVSTASDDLDGINTVAQPNPRGGGPKNSSVGLRPASHFPRVATVPASYPNHHATNPPRFPLLSRAEANARAKQSAVEIRGLVYPIQAGLGALNLSRTVFFGPFAGDIGPTFAQEMPANCHNAVFRFRQENAPFTSSFPPAPQSLPVFATRVHSIQTPNPRPGPKISSGSTLRNHRKERS